MAKILHAFGGYTVETILREPPNIFFTLAKLADRVLANDALENTLPSVCVALSGNSDGLRSRRGEVFVMPKVEHSPEQYAAAKKLADEINKGKRKLTTIDSLKITR